MKTAIDLTTRSGAGGKVYPAEGVRKKVWSISNAAANRAGISTWGWIDTTQDAANVEAQHLARAGFATESDAWDAVDRFCQLTGFDRDKLPANPFSTSLNNLTIADKMTYPAYVALCTDHVWLAREVRRVLNENRDGWAFAVRGDGVTERLEVCAGAEFTEPSYKSGKRAALYALVSLPIKPGGGYHPDGRPPRLTVIGGVSREEDEDQTNGEIAARQNALTVIGALLDGVQAPFEIDHRWKPGEMLIPNPYPSEWPDPLEARRNADTESLSFRVARSAGARCLADLVRRPP